MFSFLFLVFYTYNSEPEFVKKNPTELDLEIIDWNDDSFLFDNFVQNDEQRQIRTQVHIRDTVFENNTAFLQYPLVGMGGAYYACMSSIEMAGCIFRNNIAEYGGALALIRSNVFLSNLTITDNVAFKHGGGFYLNSRGIDGEILLSDSVIENNVAHQTGGGMYLENYKDLFIESVIFKNNTAAQTGGGAILRGNKILQPFFNNCTFIENEAGNLSTIQFKDNKPNYSKYSTFTVQYHERACGGLAVFNGKLMTTSCKFLYNRQIDPRRTMLDLNHKNIRQGTYGASLMLADVSYWFTQDDCITNYFVYNHENLININGDPSNESCQDVPSGEASGMNRKSVTWTTPGNAAPYPSPTPYTGQGTVPSYKPVIDWPPKHNDNDFKLQYKTFKTPTKYTFPTDPPRSPYPTIPPNASTSLTLVETFIVVETTTVINQTVLTITTLQKSTTYTFKQTTVVLYFTTTIVSLSESIIIIEPSESEYIEHRDIFDAKTLIIMACIIGAVLCALAILGLFLWRKKRSADLNLSEEEEENETQKTKEREVANMTRTHYHMREGHTIVDGLSDDMEQGEDDEYLNKEDI